MMKVCSQIFMLLLLLNTGLASATTFITSPSPGDQFQSDTVTFSLVNRSGNATSMWMYVGSQPGAADLHNSGSISGDTLDWTVSGLPTDSRRIYVRFYIKRPLHGWEYTDHEYLADDRADSAPYVISPVNRSILTGSSQEFDWSPAIYGATQYWLYIGSSKGQYDIYDSGSLSKTPTTVLVNGLPSDGRALFARFWWFKADSGWGYQDYRYTANSGQQKPFVTYPLEQTTASDGISLYTNLYFDAASYDVSAYWIYVGSSPGQNDFYDTGSINGKTVVGEKTSERVIFPKNGRSVYVRFYYLPVGGSSWEYTDYVFKSGGAEGKPYMSVPKPNTIELFQRTRFIWTSSLYQPSEYWLYVGTAPHSADLYDSGRLSGDARDSTLDLPANTAIFTTLYYRRDGGAWQHHDAEYVVR